MSEAKTHYPGAPGAGIPSAQSLLQSEERASVCQPGREMSVVELKAESSGYISPDWKKAIGLVYAFLGVLLILSIAAPGIKELQIGLSDLAYQFLHLFCHQKPSRCWTIGGSPLGLCVRCFALLVGLMSGRILSIYTHSKWTVVLLLTPMIIDGATQLVGLRVSTTILRVLTGGLAGVGLHLYLQQFYRKYFGGDPTWQTGRVIRGSCG